ncbi:MAG: C1 family peptidase [Fimbriimonadales bacterium]
MLALALCGLMAISPPETLPSRVDLRKAYERYGLSVCQQNGPLCWDYTVVGLLEYELANDRRVATRLSPGFLSWAAMATDSESRAGSNFGRAYRGLERYGIAPLALGGDPDGSGRGQVPTADTLRAASGLGRIDVRWIRFWNNRDPLSKDQLETMEREIADGHPVAVGMRWPNRTTFTPAGSFLLTIPDPGDIFDGHCVALVGYTLNPKLSGGGAFLFRNSWGGNWADHGYAWMPFGLLNFCINDALSVRMGPALIPVGTGTLDFSAEQFSVKDVDGPAPAIQNMRPFGPHVAR